MKRCWDQNPDNRPNAAEIFKSIELFHDSYGSGNEIDKQFKEANKYRNANILPIENNQQTTHPQAIYTSRLLNPYTKDLPKYDNIDNNSVEVTDFTK